MYVIASLADAHALGFSSNRDRVSLALRPAHNDNSITLLGYDRETGNDAELDNHTETLSLEQFLRPARKIELSGRLAYKLDGDRYYAAHTYLLGLRGVYKLGRPNGRQDIAFETRYLGVGGTSPGVITTDANFNPGASFNGSNQALTGNLNISMFGNANTYMFGVSRWNGTIGGSFADLLAGWNSEGAQGLGFDVGKSAYMADSSGSDVGGPFQVPTTGTTTPYILSDCYYPNALSLLGATVSQNGLVFNFSTDNNVTRQNNQFELGARTAGGFQDNRVWVGSIDEVIMYNSATLTAQQISQIRSYLAIKYGITLGFNTNSASSIGTDYYSGSGTEVWSGAANPTYQHDVAGIGKDLSSGLDQRISHSVNPVPNPNALDVMIANGLSANTASQGANTAFASDKTFVMWGDNNGSTAFANYSGVVRMGRVWRTQTVGTGSTQVTVRVPAGTFPAGSTPSILVTSDRTFQTGVTATPIGCAQNCSATIATFSSGSPQYFTFTIAAPVIGTALSVVPPAPQTPGTDLTYTGKFTNSGNALAQTFTVANPFTIYTAFKLNSALWSLGTSSLTTPTIQYSKDHGVTWTYVPVSGGGGAASGYDSLVTNVRFVFGGTLSSTSPDNTGTFTIVVRIL